jgi:feruloyl-CoA synthase
MSGNKAVFAVPRIRVERRADGALLLDSPVALEPYARCIGVFLEKWASVEPERAFLMERNKQGQWHGVTYEEARRKIYQIGTWLLRNGVAAEHPVVVLSDNSVDHGLLMLACMHIGVPYSAISPAYSLVSKDHAKLKALIKRLDPSVIYVSEAGKFSAALASVKDLHNATVVVSDGEAPPGGVHFSALLGEMDNTRVANAFERVNEDTVAKILFTSGSTSEPKGVINTQRMLCSSQQAKSQLWPFLKKSPPLLVDWLPWNHTFGSNHNFNLVLMHGGTLYIDGGKPMPGLFDMSVANLREIAPTLYLNVPRGFDMLVSALRQDAALRKNFFSKLQVVFYAAAAMPQHLWDALGELSKQELGYVVPMVTAWGATETSPLATDCHFHAERSGVIGLPIPGTTLKLTPNGSKLEVRVKGPNITPGYYKQPELTAKAFDEDGFYLIGDAVRFVDPSKPELGLLFDGRVTEDFKLSTGTWVSVSNLKMKAIEKLAPIAQDVVIAGHDKDFISFLIFPNAAACRQLAEMSNDVPMEQVLRHERVRTLISNGLEALREAGNGTSTFAHRTLLLADPPSVDGGEITDKGYINQAAVLKNRAHLVERLYAAMADLEIISI